MKPRQIKQKIRGWFPQEPKLGVTIHTVAPTKTDPKSLNKEEVTEITKSVIKSIVFINFGVCLIFLTLYATALNDSYFYLSAIRNAVLLVGFFVVCAFFIIWGVVEWRTYNDTIGFKGKLNYFEIVPNVIGYALMGVGIYVASIYVSRPLPNSIPDFYSWHPYSTQSFVLYGAGSAVLIATLLLYAYLIPKQIAGAPQVT